MGSYCRQMMSERRKKNHRELFSFCPFFLLFVRSKQIDMVALPHRSLFFFDFFLLLFGKLLIFFMIETIFLTMDEHPLCDIEVNGNLVDNTDLWRCFLFRLQWNWRRKKRRYRYRYSYKEICRVHFFVINVGLDYREVSSEDVR